MRFISLARNLFILSLLSVPLLYAGQFDNPYQGNIVAGDKSENELTVLALQQVLVKVSGNPKIVELNGSKRLLTQTQQLLSQYGYQSTLGKRYFTAVFDKRKINQALQEMQQPVWGDTRPATLVWLISENDGDRQLVSDNMLIGNADPALSSAVQAQQHHRGISLQFPLMDLEDNLAISLSDISGRFYGPIAAASKRYGVAHFVVADLQQSSAGKWSLSWQLVQLNAASQRSRVLATDSLSGEKSSLVSSMVNSIADYYARQYAVKENQGVKFSQVIHIHGIHSLAQLTQLNKALANLLAVASFQVTAVQDSQVTVNIKINGGLTSFKNGLSAQPNLQPDFSHDEKFHFNWVN